MLWSPWDRYCGFVKEAVRCARSQPSPEGLPKRPVHLPGTQGLSTMAPLCRFRMWHAPSSLAGRHKELPVGKIYNSFLPAKTSQAR